MYIKNVSILFSSPLWKTVSASKNKECNEEGLKEDGEFWMSFEDLKKNYTDFEICSVSVDQINEDESGVCHNYYVSTPTPDVHMYTASYT